MRSLCTILTCAPFTVATRAPDYAFDIVSVLHEYTFAAQSEDEMQIWLQMLARAVDTDMTVWPDYALDFPARLVRGFSAIGVRDPAEGGDASDGQPNSFGELELCVRCEGFGVKLPGEKAMHRFW
jgi:hypothetical protein